MREAQSYYSQYAEALEDRFSRGGLAQLRAYDHFVVWKAVSQQGKIKKVPFNPQTHALARTNDPATWGSLADSLKALRSGAYKGLGFVFGEDDPFTGVDLDHCVFNGGLTPEASDIVQTFQSYTELSPSKTGLHILVKGTVPEGRKKDDIEIYTTGRYFTITTYHLQGTPVTIEERQSQLDSFYASLTPVKATEQTILPQEHQIYVSDEMVLEKAKNAENGEAFLRLYNGNIAGFASKSNADWEFVLRLIYWTNGDPQQIRRLFLRSQLVDEKTLRPTKGTTYLDWTIEQALKKRHIR